MASATALKPVPPALPATTAGFLAHRNLKAKRTINDLVEDIHLKLVENDKYRSYLFAIYDEQAIEGRLEIDDVKAAEMIRKQADDDGLTELANEKLAAIIHGLHTVLRRYKFSRKERRDTVGGQVVTEN